MIIVGHRGARKEAPENTIEGFVHAQANGCMHFELDIQLSSDHELVVFHDTGLKRVTGKRGKLATTPYHRLNELDARLNTPGWPSACYIPHLQDVIDSAPLTLHWQFEVKTDSRHRLTILARELARFIEENDMGNTVTITTSDRWLLQHLAHQYPSISRGYVGEYPIPDPIEVAVRSKCEYLCLDRKLASQMRIDRAHEQGMHVSCWTVNQISEMEELVKKGVDSIITDRPTSALKHFGMRA